MCRFLVLARSLVLLSVVANENSSLAFYVVDFSTVQGMVASVNCWVYPSGNPGEHLITGSIAPFPFI